MAEFHFVQDYVEHVKNLKEKYPLDEAMSMAVGGDYERIGAIAADILVSEGLSDGDRLLDFGCGSGRVAHAIAQRVNLSEYLGTDVVQDLLDYAATKTPQHYKFTLNRTLDFPAADSAFSHVCAFSVFTHLLQTECFLYLRDIRRVLSPGGTLIASFLEFRKKSHWDVFEASFDAPHLNTFIEQSQWTAWAERAGLQVVKFIDGHELISKRGFLGQSVVILRKPV